MKNSGCFSGSKHSAKIEPTASRSKTSSQPFLEYLKSRTTPMLGLTEPTLCGFGQRRLHEEDPLHLEIGRPRPLHDILLQHTDFVRVQQLLDGSATEVQLPRMVQFELAWITEQLPQSRASAATDRDYCFFFREEAEVVMLDHIQQLDQHGIAINLLWHHYHPAHAQLTAAEVGSDPFAPVADSATKLALHDMMRHLNDHDIALLDELSQAFIQTQRNKLDLIAAFAQKLEALGISAVFRPYHEHSGHWFWWGIPNMNLPADEAHQLFVQFWKNTRQYLEDQGVCNLLYAYSPDVPDQPSDSAAEFAKHYKQGCDPETIDIMGLDFYLDKRLQHPFSPEQMNAVSEECLQYLQWIHELYPQHVIALTETGIRFGTFDIDPATEVDGATFWQHYFLPLWRDKYQQLPLAYITLWRNSPGDYIHPHPASQNAFLTEITALIDHLDTVPYPVTSATETEPL